jgi:N-acetylglutamate synthase-like GNAT family acetyltransferase
MYRYHAKPEDLENVKIITESTGFFYDYEVDVAVELIQDKLAKGDASDYKFIFIESEGRTIAYSCYGHIACTKNSYDLYWIVTNNDFRGKGFGRLLLKETENKIKEAGGKKIYAETSSLPKYEPTRKFYLTSEYIAESVLKDFYNDNDDKIVYVKRLF